MPVHLIDVGFPEVSGPRGHHSGTGWVGAFNEPGMCLNELTLAHTTAVTWTLFDCDP